MINITSIPNIEFVEKAFYYEYTFKVSKILTEYSKLLNDNFSGDIIKINYIEPIYLIIYNNLLDSPYKITFLDINDIENDNDNYKITIHTNKA